MISEGGTNRPWVSRFSPTHSIWLLVLSNPKRPLIIILGGAKVSDKVGVIRNLMRRASVLLIGGGMANTFLMAKGFTMGASKVEEEAVLEAGRIMDEASSKDIEIVLPLDLVVASSFSANRPP